MCLNASVFTCETEVEEAVEDHREAACANKSEKYCLQKACDCVCVCLNYLAQRPDRGLNEVRSSLLQHFSSLHPSLPTSSTHQSSSSCSVTAELLPYSACLDKPKLSNKRLPACYSCPFNYRQTMKGKTLIQLNRR